MVIIKCNVKCTDVTCRHAKDGICTKDEILIDDGFDEYFKCRSYELV